MKKFIPVFLLAAWLSFPSFQYLKAQDKIEEEEGIWLEPDISYAEPKGGIKAFYKHVAENLNYPNAARCESVQGRVFVQFVVEKDGSLSEFKILRGLHPDIDQEAIRIIQSYPEKWIPTKINGKPVSQRISLPISFNKGSNGVILITSKAKSAQKIVEEMSSNIKVFPNPATEIVQIELEMAQTELIKIQVFSTQKELIEKIVQLDFEKGKHTFTWDTKNVQTGLYLIEVQQDKKVTTHKVMVVK